MKKSTIIILSIVAVIILAIAIPILINPLRGSGEQIKTRILRQIPIGTSMENVEQIVEANRRWDLQRISHYSSFPGDRIGMNVGGEYEMQVFLGMIFFHQVDVFFGFDETGYLVDVRVRKVLAI